MSACPNPDELQALLADSLAPGESLRLSEHLTVCQACRDTVDRWLDGGEVDRWREMWQELKNDDQASPTGGPAQPQLIGAAEEMTVSAADGEAAPGGHWPDDAEQLLEGVPGIRVVRVLGRGAYGIVFLAQDDLHPQLAVKVLHPGLAVDAREVQRFEQEARNAASINHENVVTIHQVGTTPVTHLPYIVMEYVEGETLRERLNRRGRLDSREAAELVRQAALGLQAAHARGLVHRDIKPSNLLVTAQSERVKITDFGLAAVTEAGRSERLQSERVAGTGPYLSPEQFVGPKRIDQRSDVYGLGVVLYELLTGERPFRGTEFALYLQIIHDDPPPPRKLHPEADPDLEAICLKCLQKEMDRRYASATELAEDVKRFLNDQPVHARRDSLTYRGLKFAKRHKSAVIAGIFAMVGLILAVIAGTVAAMKYQAAQQMRHERLISQAIAAQARPEPGRRFDALRALAEAADIEPSLKIQNEAIACLALADLRLDRLLPVNRGFGFAMDWDFQRYARSDANGNVAICRLDDDGELQRLPGFGKPPQRLQFSPDGRHLAALYFRGSGHDEPDREFRVWNVQVAKSLKAIPARISGEAWSFRPDGQQLAVGQSDGSVVLCDLPADSEMGRLATGPWIGYLAWHPTSGLLAESIPNPSQVRIVDLESGEIRYELPMQESVRGLAWRSDGRQLAMACGRRVVIWTPEDPEPPTLLKGHRYGADRVAFDHAGDLLASYGWDSLIRLWDPATGEELLRCPGEHCLQFAPDDRRLVGARLGSAIGVWELAPPRELVQLRGHGESVGAFTVSFSPDGRLLASASFDGACLWEADRSGGPLTRLTWKSSGVCAFHPQGTGLLASGRFGVFYWPLSVSDDGRTLRFGSPARLPLDDYAFANHFGFSDEGRRLITVLSDRPRVLDFVLEGPPYVRELGNACKAGHVAISPAGKWAATGSWDGDTTTIWSLPSGRRQHELKTGDSFVFFSPDGRWLLTGGHDKYTFWEVGSWQPAWLIPRTGSGQRGPAAFTLDGSVVAIAKSADEVQLIDVTDGSEIATLRPPHKDVIAWMSFSPDSRSLAVSCEGGDIQVWRLDRIDAQLAAHGLRWHSLVRSGLEAESIGTTAHIKECMQVEFSPTAYPAGFRMQPAAELAWQPTDPFQARKWHETLAGLNRAIEQEPQQWLVRQERGLNLARFAQWEQAEADFLAAIELGTDSPSAWYYLALTRMARNDLAGYRAACGQLLDRFGGTTNPSDANMIAWTCALQSDAVEDYRPLLALSELAVSQRASHLHQNTLGAVRFRAGQVEHAIRDLERAIELHALEGTPLDWLFLAMAHGQSGQTEEARRWIDRTRTWLAQPGRELTWIERLEYDLLLSEAQQSMASTHTP